MPRWQVRPDGSTFHVVRFDEQTGLPVWRGTVQGAADGSTWARGHAWAVHGFTTAYGESRDQRLLDAARQTAGFAVAHVPRDGVPWWDYDAPGTRRDTTAAAVLASGLLELARIDPDPDLRARWRAAGMHTLRSLVGPRYLASGTGAWSVLLHGRHDPTYDDERRDLRRPLPARGPAPGRAAAAAAAGPAGRAACAVAARRAARRPRPACAPSAASRCAGGTGDADPVRGPDLRGRPALDHRPRRREQRAAVPAWRPTTCGTARPATSGSGRWVRPTAAPAGRSTCVVRG